MTRNQDPLPTKSSEIKTVGDYSSGVAAERGKEEFEGMEADGSIQTSDNATVNKQGA